MLGDIRQGRRRYELPREGFGILVCVSSHLGMINHMLIQQLHVFLTCFFILLTPLRSFPGVCVCVLFPQLLRIWHWSPKFDAASRS